MIRWGKNFIGGACGTPKPAKDKDTCYCWFNDLKTERMVGGLTLDECKFLCKPKCEKKYPIRFKKAECLGGGPNNFAYFCLSTFVNALAYKTLGVPIPNSFGNGTDAFFGTTTESYGSGDTDDSNDSDGDGSDPLQSTTEDPMATTE